MNHLILAVLALVSGAGLCLLNVDNRVRAALGLCSQAIAMGLVWSVAIPVLMGGPEVAGGISWAHPIGALHFRLDALGAFFLVWSLPMTLLGSVYAVGYLRKHFPGPRHVGVHFALLNMVALSFVRSASDVEPVRRIMDEEDRHVPVIAKLEKPQAIENLGAIIDTFDAFMVARGDLGVELPLEEVPLVQKRIIRAARKWAKPVIVATQMLESMISAAVPTRAEASDVATAIYDGADAVMLSAESASGRYPLEAVQMMSKIIRQVENGPDYQTQLDVSRPKADATVSDAISCAIRRISSILPVAVLVMSERLVAALLPELMNCDVSLWKASSWLCWPMP